MPIGHPLRLRLARHSTWLFPTAFAPRWNSTATQLRDGLHDGPPVTDTNRAEATQKRFWKDVGIEKRGDSLTVTLDKRALKTPAGQTLLLPLNKTLPAVLIATEWDHQEVLLKPHALPMTSIVSRALDDMEDDTTRAEVREALLKYLDTDTICFFHNNPEPLERLQSKHWSPLLDWARTNFDVQLNISASILSAAQPTATREKFRKVMESFDQWEMAAMERATFSSKSLIIALALIKNHLTVEEAALAATVEVNSQIERWGEMEDTHRLEYHDVRRQLGSAACLLSSV